jgi:high-affinity nickel-transport protein
MFPLVETTAAGAGIGVLLTGLLLGLRHGIDWDHIAAITDITSTTTASEAAESTHDAAHTAPGAHDHPHGGDAELRAHVDAGRHSRPWPGEGPGTLLAAAAAPAGTSVGFLATHRRPLTLGTLYALGHALVVVLLGLAALAFGASLPAWIDPIMGRIVGVTLIVLGVYVFVSVYQYARHGTAFRLRSRWMLFFDGARHTWRRLQAAIHGHRHVDPVEASAYGPATAFGVGMVHGVGAETASQVLIIAAVGGAASAGLGVPMLFAFVIGLVLSNGFLVVLSATGFGASRFRERLYVSIGAVAGAFSLVIGTLFLLGAEGGLPSLDGLLGFIG